VCCDLADQFNGLVEEANDTEMVTIPGKHKDSAIAFRPSAWAKALIEQRAGLSGM